MFEVLTKHPTLLLLAFWVIKLYTVWDALTDTSSLIPGSYVVGLMYILFGIFEILIGIHFDYFKNKNRSLFFCGVVLSPLLIYAIGLLITGN